MCFAMELQNCYHLCTEALKNRLLCNDEQDYAALWNILAVCAIVQGIKIYCICLMSNHIHILLAGDTAQIQTYFALVKKKVGMYLRQRYPHHTLPDLDYKLFPVPDKKAFRREVAYILRNPYKAGVASPYSYKWSSAPAYFHPFSVEGNPLSDFHYRERREILHTRLNLPDKIRISNGAVLPESFVDRLYVERMFDNSSIQFFNLIKSWNLEDVVHAMHGEQVVDRYTDSEVQKGISELCRDIFQVSSPHQLEKRSLYTLARRVYARFGCNQKQLERLLPVDSTLLDRIL